MNDDSLRRLDHHHTLDYSHPSRSLTHAAHRMLHAPAMLSASPGHPVPSTQNNAAMAAAAAAAITVQSHSQSLHLNPTPTTPNNNSNKLMLAKPAVGTVEWQRLRRDNHKEVERRRREAINSGVAELSKIVPGCEKAKGSILQRTIQYIHEMREADQSNVEKWTLEKILMDQAIQELTRELEVTRDELQRVKGEREVWRERAEAATAAISGEPLDKKRRK